MKAHLFLAAVVCSCTIAAAPRGPVTSSFSAAIDAELQAHNPNTNNGGASQATVGTTDPVSDDIHRVVLKFDVSDLPTNTTFTNSTLRLYITGVIGDLAVSQAYVRRLTQSGWVESQVTWNKYDSSNSWTTAGGDFTTTDQASFNIGAGGMTANSSWDLTGLDDRFTTRSTVGVVNFISSFFRVHRSRGILPRRGSPSTRAKRHRTLLSLL